MCLNAQGQQVNMCTDIIHKYTCGHTKKDKAPCAGKKSGGCKGQGVKTVTHSERCPQCGKCEIMLSYMLQAGGELTE